MKRPCVTNLPIREGANVSMLSLFSEQEILDLQDLFLVNGCHRMNVVSVSCGRNIIMEFLDSLYFSRIACLSTAPLCLSRSVISLYEEMALDGALAFSHEQLDRFIFNELVYDFLWIECTPTLLQLPWFYYFERKILEEASTNMMPILFVSYGSPACI